jgi:hypothetical protein
MAINGPLLPEHYRAWQGLRNAFVHSLEQEGASVEKLLDRVRLVYQALIALILDRIGYSGPMTDFATVGWPTIVFPFFRPSTGASPPD